MSTRSNQSRSLQTNRGLEKLEPYEGKLSCTVLRGERGSNASDLPDRPSDLEQREGRAIRKGNEVAKLYNDNKVDVIIYAVERSLDAYKFNLLHCKQTFIHQLKSGAMGARTIDDGSSDEKSGMNYSEYVAILSGNTDLLEKAKLEKRIAALESEHRSFNKGLGENRMKLRSRTDDIEKLEIIISKMEEDRARFMSVVQRDSDGNAINALKLDKCEFSDTERMGKYLQSLARSTNTQGEYVRIGEIYGFPVSIKSERTLVDGVKALKAELATLDQKITAELAPKQEKQDFGEDVKIEEKQSKPSQRVENPSRLSDSNNPMVAEPITRYKYLYISQFRRT